MSETPTPDTESEPIDPALLSTEGIITPLVSDRDLTGIGTDKLSSELPEIQVADTREETRRQKLAGSIGLVAETPDKTKPGRIVISTMPDIDERTDPARRTMRR